MRLSLKTPNAANNFPAILDADMKFPKITNFTMVDLKNDTQKKALDKLTFFAPHRLKSKFGIDKDIKTPDSFYFRMNKDGFIYYTETAKDTIVLMGMTPIKV
jgi:hypothetical protein